jgi:hydrogenase expression/formation protein HypD
MAPPAITAILDSPDNQVQGFLAAGHVCAVIGYTQYEPIAARYRVPIVVTGFEPLDLLEGILITVRQLQSGRAEVENQYAWAVQRGGNDPPRDRCASARTGRRYWWCCAWKASSAAPAVSK